jgi:hypothetical protein
MSWETHGESAPAKIIGIDVNGKHNEVLTNLIANMPNQVKTRIYPSIGRGITATQCPIVRFSQYIKNHGVENWYWTDPSPKNKLRTCIFCANSWKTRLHQRLALPPFMAGGLHLNPKAKDLKICAEHYLSENVAEVTAENEYGTRTMIQFSETPKPNHRFDCFVGNCVAASILGIGRQAPQRRQRSRRRIAYG